jgi:hypothetical protein
MSHSLDVEETMAMLDDCIKRDNKMSTWECDFVESVKDQLIAHGRLSEKQLATLNKIWEKVT